MCNEHRSHVDIDQLSYEFSQIGVPLRFPEGLPNLPPSDSIKITDRHAIVRQGNEGAELVMRRWSWLGPTGKPVYNFRSEGRSFDSGRVLIIADGFYEFTDPPPVEGRPRSGPRASGSSPCPIAPSSASRGSCGTTRRSAKHTPCSPPHPGRTSRPITTGRLSYLGAATGQSGSILLCLRPAPAGTLKVTQVR